LRRRPGSAARQDTRERIHHRWREIVVVLGRQLQPAVGTEAEARLDRGAASPAACADAGPTRMTELLPGNEIDAARDAAHRSAATLAVGASQISVPPGAAGRPPSLRPTPP